jgi:hypothetical protein
MDNLILFFVGLVVLFGVLFMGYVTLVCLTRKPVYHEKPLTTQLRGVSGIEEAAAILEQQKYGRERGNHVYLTITDDDMDTFDGLFLTEWIRSNNNGNIEINDLRTQHSGR